VTNERYADDKATNKHKRCIQCKDFGHFKCRTEEESKQVKLTFTVEDNLDEFVEGRNSFSRLDRERSSSAEIVSQTSSPTKNQRKREKKRSQKRKAKKQLKRLENSNIMVPPSDGDSSDEFNSDASDASSDQSQG